MSTLAYFFIFCLGCIIGSFLNVVIYRFNSGKTLGGRSMCMTCSKTLSWYELIPVFSYLFQVGKCRSCSTRISHQYPLVEFLTGGIFTLIAYHFSGFALVSFNQYILLVSVYMMIFSLLMVISVYDMRHKIIPDPLVFAFIVFSFISMFLNHSIVGGLFVQPSVHSIIAGPLFALPFALIWLLSRGRFMGLGDAKLILGIGWMLGFYFGIAALMLSFWIGTIVSLLIIAFTKMKFSMNTEIPFGPFLAISTLLVFVFSITVFDLASIFTF